VIIPVACTQDSARIEKTLQALTTQTLPPGEIILVSYGSEKPNLTDIEAKFNSKPTRSPQLKKLDCPGKNLNQARNAGIEHAAGRLIIFLDEWLIAGPKLVETYLNDSNQSSPNLSVSAGLIDWSVELEKTPLREYLRATGEGQFFNFDRIKNFNEAGYHYFNASNLAVSRSVLMAEKERCGYIFEAGFESVWGDRELGYRLQKKGLKVRFLPAAVAHSARPVDLAVATADQFNKGKAAFLFSRKYPELETTDTDFNLVAALERYHHLTRAALSTLTDRVARLEEISRIGVQGVLIQGKPVDLLIGQILQSLYNTLLTAYSDLGAGIAYRQSISGEADARNFDLETGLASLTERLEAAAFSLDLNLDYRPSIKSEEQLIDRLSLLIHEKQLEIESLLADPQKKELALLRETIARQAEQIQKQQEATNFYQQEFTRAEQYALHVESEYNRLLESGKNRETFFKSRFLKKIGLRFRNGLPSFSKK
jgi:hypothetical protein